MLIRVLKAHRKPGKTCPRWIITLPDKMARALELESGDQMIWIEVDGTIVGEKFTDDHALKILQLRGLGAKILQVGRKKKRPEATRALNFNGEAAA